MSVVGSGARVLDQLVGPEGDYRFGHVIDGVREAVPDAGEQSVVNPSSAETIAEVPLGSAADADRAVAAARRALPGWRHTTPADRAGALLALAQLIDDNAQLFADLESLNVGKPSWVATGEIGAASDTLRFMAGALRTVSTPAADEYVEGYLSFVRREPLGVVAAITPWNFPLSTAVAKFAPALAAGNTVVVKPSELTPLTTVLFADLAQAILPPGVLNVVLGTGLEVGQALAVHPGVDALSMTGSIATGVALARAGADTLKPLRFELGGKTPVVIFEDADLPAAAELLRMAGTFNSGQCCGAATRIIVADAVHDRLVELLGEQVGSLHVGDPALGEAIEMGPVVSDDHLRKVEGLVQGAVGAGASVRTGGCRVAGERGFFYAPTVLTDIPAGEEILRTEIFGPVMTVERFTDEEQAIELANNTEYGLVASVWTESTRRALRVVDALEHGTVEVNTALKAPVEMPFGGFGMSGLGYENSSYAIDDFSRKKHVVLAK